MDKDVKVLLTGGHAGTTALAVIQEIRKRKDTKDWIISWIGAKHAIEGKKVATLESVSLPQLGVACYSITSGRLQRTFTRFTIPSLLRIPIGLFHAFSLVRKIHPRIVLSFGGYAAFPVVLSAWLLRVPVVIHEQVATAGRSSIASSRFASKIAISRKTSVKFFPKSKTVLTGNPIMESIASLPPKKKIGNPPVLFVTGGSRGSQSINSIISALLPSLLSDFEVIHQTGSLDFDQMKRVRDELSPTLSKRYTVLETIVPLTMHTFYERADIVLGRSGANTVSEVLMLKRPSIFIPLPFAYNDEQKANALFAKEFGLAEIIDQKDATPEGVYTILKKITSDWQDIVSGVLKKESPDVHAAQNVVDLLLTYA
jgi:UDP-N-acetylglucosamine--N-acetylmuramyl-(pentapeptide) pyrophosphoryl-undecaprenol N-acetylglucosamine transferase